MRRPLFAVLVAAASCASCTSPARTLQTRASVLNYAASVGSSANSQLAVTLLQKCTGHALISFSFPAMEPDSMYVRVRKNNDGRVSCMTHLYRNGQPAGAAEMVYCVADAEPAFANLCRLVARGEVDVRRSGEIFDVGKVYHVVTGAKWALSSNRDGDYHSVFRELARLETCEDDANDPTCSKDCIHMLRVALSSGRSFASFAAATDNAIGAFDDACRTVSASCTEVGDANPPVSDNRSQ